jgi:hypothetical protein
MKNIIKISCVIDTTNSEAALGMEVWLDNQQIVNQDWVTESQLISYEFSDLDAEHELRFVMKNKTAEHTTIDESGFIVKDACLIISDLAFDEIPLGHVLVEKAVYSHNSNGFGDLIQDKFFGQMGCNGTVSLKFTTPIHIWLLENM